LTISTPVPAATPPAGTPLFAAFVTGPSAVAAGAIAADAVGVGVGLADVLGSDAGAGAGAGAAFATTTTIDAESSVPAALVARTTNVNDPTAVGVPDSTPVEAFSVNPVGNEPEKVENVGLGEPVAVKVYEYAVPGVPDAGGDSFTNEGAAATATVIGALSSLPPLFVARTTKVNDPPVVGVPDSTPVEAFSVNPVGNEPEKVENVGLGVPVAVKV
jgi:hypothetical protein